MFQRPSNLFGHPRVRRLTQLYSDTKQSYELLARVGPQAFLTGSPPPRQHQQHDVKSGLFFGDEQSSGVVASPLEKDANGFVVGADGEEDVEVLRLRKEFQIQQDRLLAWGVFWADVGASQSQSQSPATASDGSVGGGEKGKDVEIDRKIDQAGLGDLVASVMEEIKRLLDESGKLQHPGRWERHQHSHSHPHPRLHSDQEYEQKSNLQQSPHQQRRLRGRRVASHGGGNGGLGAMARGVDNKEYIRLDRWPSAPTGLDSKDDEQFVQSTWTSHEVQTGRVLLEKLTSCIDVLYSLVDHSGAEERQDPVSSPTAVNSSFEHHHQPHSDYVSLKEEETASAAHFNHPLHIDFARLQPMHDPSIDDIDRAEPPSYDEVQNTATDGGIQARSMYYYGDAQVHVIVDLLATSKLPELSGDINRVEQDDPVTALHKLAEQLSSAGLLSWHGHLKLLGFTVAGPSRTNTRFGLVYALPAPSDPTALQRFQSLSSTIAASYEHDASMPSLENKFRLAYNIALLAIGHLAHNSTHGYIRSSNIIFLRENSTSGSGGSSPQLGMSLRSPYLLHPVQQLVGPRLSLTAHEPLQETIYHHPDSESAGYGVVAAHDVYSIGLLLFEIGMWLPLRKFWKPKYVSDRHIFVERLRKTYSPKLASKCGSRYMKAVQLCLDAPEALVDKPGSINAAEYLLEAIKELACCCMLDEIEQPSGLDIEIFEAMIEEARIAFPEDDELARKATLTRFKDKALPETPAELPSDAIRDRTLNGKRIKSRRAVKSVEHGPSLRKFPEMLIPQPQLDIWNARLMPKLQHILNGIFLGSKESAVVSLMMVGQTPEKAVTTIVVQCRDSHTAKVHEELKVALKTRLRLGRGWGLVVMKGDVRRSGRRKANKNIGSVRRSLLDMVSTAKTSNQVHEQRKYQKRPGCGASIGACKDGEHLPPVSLGGTILIDDEPFKMSVHHMLDDVSDRESDDELESEEDETAPTSGPPVRSSLTRSAAHAELGNMGSHIQLHGSPYVQDQLELSEDDIELDYGSDSDTSTIRPDYSTFDDEGNEFWFMDDPSSLPDLDDDDGSWSDSSDQEDEDRASVGDRPGHDLYTASLTEDDELCVTQPAIDDVEDDFFPSIEDRDDDHLSSHSFGYIHVSSGIRRMVKNNIKHEIDWALIKADEDRCGFAAASSLSALKTKINSSANPSRFLSEPYLTTISSLSSLPNTKVRAIGRTSGPSTGCISQAMSLVKFHGRTSFSSSFTIQGGFGVPGDSGAWVWSEERKELCGHVLAWADGLKVAFMAPMEILIDDMKEQLGASKVELVSSVFSKENKTPVSRSKMTNVNVNNVVSGKQVVNEQLERARELEVAFKRLSFEPAGGIQNQERGRETYEGGHSAASSASSGFQRNDAGERIRKERFDVRVTGRKDVQALPMARALS